MSIRQLQIQPELIYFKGHFPKVSILPGIAQLEWAIAFAIETYEQLNSNKVHRIDWMKFMKPISAGSSCSLKLELVKAGHLKFKFYNDDSTFSSGLVIFDD